MIKFNWSMRACGILFLWAATAVALPAQTTAGGPHAPKFTTLHSFDETDGSAPSAALIQATDGHFYGTTYGGGADGDGTVFTITANGTLTTLHSFDYTDGAYPGATLVQDADGNFYGTTFEGGAKGNDNCVFNSCGTVFKITPSGVLTTLHTFDYTDGQLPGAALVLARDGNLYGTTEEGGASDVGTVFKISPSGAGTLTTLHSFDSMDGAFPSAGLVQGADENFYGTTYEGGANGCRNVPSGCGTVFTITASGTLTTLHSFNYTDGANPEAGLVQGTDGKFYGTTSYGGAKGNCGSGDHCGTVFKLTPSGVLTTLYNFCSRGGDNCTDGLIPQATLIQATNGDFYGTTYAGGANSSSCIAIYGYPGCGTVFKITPSGTLTTLHSFDDTDGALPQAGLVRGTDGKFYGTTSVGGANDVCSDEGCGTVFSLSVGLK
jgi:uncharacterized repeat protein (TIGR03803 family)